MSFGQSDRTSEGTRPCTVCRMPVSVLAVKCHHCGAEVGRPKEAARQLTAEDLGGETVVHYAPSSNVMDALESFRAEESVTKAEAARQADPKTLFGRKARKADGVKADMEQSGSALPELDERSRALASIAMPRRPTTTIKKRSNAPDMSDYLRWAGITVGVVVFAYVAVFLAPGWIKEWTTPKVEVFVSRYPALKDSGAKPLALLDAAAEALRHQVTDEHRAQIEEAREAVISQVEGIIDGRTISAGALQEASIIAKDAFARDPDPRLGELKQRVDRENSAYAAVLSFRDTTEKTAKFVVGGKTVDVSEGDTLVDKFEVKAVTQNGVRVVDTEHPERGELTVALRDSIVK